MPTDRELNQRDTKLVTWLNEAHAKEAELEADLTAHVALTRKASYKKRLQQHLKETREHKRATAKRIKAIGGQAVAGPAVPGVPEAVGEAAGKTVAAVKGQIGAARALVTSEPETHLRNAQEELREEHVEIAIYTRIETLATAVGDTETAQLAKRIRREEERMAKYLDAELQRLVKDIVRTEIPRAQRAKPAARRRSTRSGSRSTARSRTSAGGSASTRSRANGSGARSTGSSARSTGSGARSTGSGARSTASTSTRRAASSSSRRSS